MKGGTPPPDTDHDGIPDDWEIAHGLNPNDPSDAAKKSTNGYSNLELYLNSIKPDPATENNPSPPSPTARALTAFDVLQKCAMARVVGYVRNKDRDQPPTAPSARPRR